MEKMNNADLKTIIAINQVIATIRDPLELFYKIIQRLVDVLGFSLFGLAMFDSSKTFLEIVLVATDPESDLLKTVPWRLKVENVEFPFLPLPGIASVQTLPIEMLAKYHKDELTLNMFAENVNKNSIEKMMVIPIQVSGDTLGYLILAFPGREKTPQNEDFLLQIGNLIGNALSNAIAYSEMKIRKEENETLLRLINALVTEKKREKLFVKLAAEIDKLINCDYLAFSLSQKPSGFSSILGMQRNDNDNFDFIAASRSMNLGMELLCSLHEAENESTAYELKEKEVDYLVKRSAYFRLLKEKQNISSFLVASYASGSAGQLIVLLGRRENRKYNKNKVNFVLGEIDNSLGFNLLAIEGEKDNFHYSEIDILKRLMPQIVLVLMNYHAFEAINMLMQKLEQEKNYLLEEINLGMNFQEIIGVSQAIQSVLNKVQQVAPLDATVLINGETGTGKELVARAVHNLSGRKDQAFVKINCASLPAELIESELFGHEKGSFTGAIEKRIGRFELADGGTIFLDEIGELPLNLQPKLLRVLQEKEFERIGGKSTIHSDVRVVAATNRDLQREVDEGRFRADLFFRLNVFPILIPPLRERREDIPLLTRHFLEINSKKIGKPIPPIRKSDMETLMNHDWPGNIRELEHVIERGLIVSDSTHLNVEILLSGKTSQQVEDVINFKSLEEYEKEYIMKALRAANFKVTGEKGAAQLLGLNGKTLGSKMRKLGIKREVTFKTQS